MVPLTELWLPILLSAVAVFVLSSLVWMVFPHHKTDFKKLPDEDGVMNGLRARMPDPGLYMIPFVSDPKDVEKPEVKQKLEQGPCGYLTVIPSGIPTMGKKLLQTFVLYVFLSVLVAYVTGTAFTAGQAYIDVFRIAGTVAIMGHGTGVLTGAIWFGTPWSNTWKHLADSVLYGLVTAGIFGWLWP